ncbi:MAG: hypothetical protein EXS08_13025 [Planctomycetes bacterium]|nr:hypothetical protein [Planctomycetota bacterium]
MMPSSSLLVSWAEFEGPQAKAIASAFSALLTSFTKVDCSVWSLFQSSRLTALRASFNAFRA